MLLILKIQCICFQSFGHEHMLTFSALKQLGLFTELDAQVTSTFLALVFAFPFKIVFSLGFFLILVPETDSFLLLRR